MAIKEKNVMFYEAEFDFTEKIEVAMMGLIDLFEINISEQDIFYHLGLDNINGFYNNFVKYLNSYLYDHDERALIELSEKIYSSIIGFKEVIKIVFDASDIMYKIGMENVKALKRNFVKFTHYFY
jgi:hypothetical protein